MPEIHETLQALTEAIQKLVNGAILDKTIEAGEELFWQWRVRDFEYTDSGITSSGAEGDHVTKKTWFKASIELRKNISGYPAFTTALEELKRAYPAIPEMPSYLEQFAGAVLGTCLTNSGAADSSEIEKITIRFINDLAGRPVTTKARVELQGVTLRSERISLDVGINIRQPNKEDLEVTIRPGFHQLSPPNPSAIIEIELQGPRGQNVALQTTIQQFVALFRLFDVGSVKSTSYEMESDSVIGWTGRTIHVSGDKSAALETYVIKDEDEEKLKRFWSTMSNALPKDIYDFQKQVNHITLAYDRYSDALLHNGIIERRVANAVMGLEALLLEESQELSYRLGMRASKLLSLMGKNPLEVRAIMKDAYFIRSAFAHGSHLTYKAKKKLEQRYGTVKKLLLQLLDYLRVSIVVMILSHKGKEEFIDLTDDALVDSARHDQLKACISGVKTIAVG